MTRLLLSARAHSLLEARLGHLSDTDGAVLSTDVPAGDFSIVPALKFEAPRTSLTSEPKAGVTVTFEDPTDTYTAMAAQMIADAKAAFNLWRQSFAPSAGTIDIDFHLVPTYPNRGGGSSVTTSYLQTVGGIAVYDQGAGYEVRTGNDPNGSSPDIDVFFDVNFVAQHYWVNPLDGAPVPGDKNDLVSVLAHEMGHALAFNGWRNWSTYQLSDNTESTFDALVSVVGGLPYFNGKQAMKLYGGPVPLTAGNLFHVGNASGIGSDLGDGTDLMNGVVFLNGVSLKPSALDVAILSDCGLPTILPDVLLGGTASDKIYGGGGSDQINGGDNADSLFGDAGKDTLIGGLGGDALYGGVGQDVLSGGDGDDVLSGGAAGDRIAGGAGNDTATYGDVSESTGAGYDTLTGFDFRSADHIDLNVSVHAIDSAVSAVSLATGSLNIDLTAALSGHLLAHDAILVTASSGNLAGRTFLIVDANGVAGYQSDADYVFCLSSPTHLSRLDVTDFT